MYEIVPRSRTSVAGIDAQVVDYLWSEPHCAEECSPAHILSFSLTAVPPSSRALYRGVTRDFEPVGKIVFMPARTEMVGACDGGMQTVMNCRISEDRFETLMGQRCRWSDGELRMGLDLSGEHLFESSARLTREILSPGFANSIAIEAMTTLLLVDVMRSLGRDIASDSSSLARGGLTPLQLRRIEDRIHDTALPLPSVADIASDLGLSGRHLLRAYRQSTGSTLRTSIQRASRERAMVLLRETDLPLKTIAFRLGFQTFGSFSTAFRNSVGETPSQFRRRPH
jgi:AraC family transcriptional regulator